jgi:hypothetical protein
MSYADLASTFSSSDDLKGCILDSFPDLPPESLEFYALKYVQIFEERTRLLPAGSKKDEAAFLVAIELDQEISGDIAARLSLASNIMSAPGTISYDYLASIFASSGTLVPRIQESYPSVCLEDAQRYASKFIEVFAFMTRSDLCKVLHKSQDEVAHFVAEELDRDINVGIAAGRHAASSSVALAPTSAASAPQYHVVTIDLEAVRLRALSPDLRAFEEMLASSQSAGSSALAFGPSASTLVSSSGSLVRPVSATGSECSMRSVSPVTVATFMASGGAPEGVGATADNG